MKQNIIHIGLDVDDTQYHGPTFNKDTGEVAEPLGLFAGPQLRSHPNLDETLHVDISLHFQEKCHRSQSL